jgi:type II secretory pathway component GspD/PulD (secretin)
VKTHLAVATLLISLVGAPARAQEQKGPTAPPLAGTLKVQVTLARYQGEKKVSSLPYTLTVNTDERNRNTGRASLRLGTQVPLTTMTRLNGDANSPMVPTVQYRDVGTSIDCSVVALDAGQFKLDLTIEDSSIDTASSGGGNTSPAFKSFRTSDTMLLRDGQSAQYSTATDKVNGEVWKVDVTLTVVK